MRLKRLFLLVVIAAAFLLALTAISGGGKGNATAHNSQQQQGVTYHFSLNVSHQVARINQLDCSQYASQSECDTWAYSTCSTAALTEVMNFYGRHLRIHDVLAVQARIGAITPALGLTEDAGIADTATQFGFQVSWGYRLTLDQLIRSADNGAPVIAGWPPSRYPDGHLVVVTGGNGSSISIADSSRFNRRTLTRAQFLAWWGGFSAIVTPAQGGQP